jgi:D-amino-acid dehydrogenase
MSRHPMDMTVDAVVLGAGVVGVTTAHALAIRGGSVCIVDRAAGPARGASFANGAQLSYAYTDALASPALLAKLPKLALGLDPLFRLKPGLDPSLYSWLAAFLREMTPARFARNTCAILELALASQSAMHRLLEHTPIAFDHAVPGKMHLYHDRESLSAAARTIALKQSHGAAQEILTPREAIAIEPALAQVESLAGVVHSPADAVGDARKFSEALLALCERELGVAVRFGDEVESIERRGDRWRIRTAAGAVLAARRIVLCAGAQSRAIGGKLGLDLPVQPMKGYSFTASPGADAPGVSITDTRRKIVFCRLGGKIRVASLAELGVHDTRINPERMALVRTLARDALPRAADYAAIEQEWAGLRPMTPNSQPIIRWVDPALGVNTGHGMLGWTLAMGSAERLAAAMPALTH